MKRIWAPWRIEYIQSDRLDDECFLCKSLSENDDRKNLLLKRSDCCGVIMNRYPYNNGHLLVFPQRHVGCISELDGAERAGIMELISASVEIIREKMNPDGFNIGYNIGKAAGAGLEDHLHAHIVPRWNGDTNFMPVLAGTRVIPQSLEDLYDQIAPEF